MTGEPPAVHEALAVYAPEAPETERVPPGYKLSEVGVIPEDWESVPIGSIAKFTSGVLINASTLHRQSPQFSIPVFGGNGIAGYTSGTVALDPTVVIGRVGQKCGSVCRTDGPAWITDNALYPKQMYRSIDVDFLALALEGARLNEVRNRNDLPLITQSIVHDVQIALPVAISEQRAIAAALSDVDALISALDKLISKKRAVKTAAMQQLLTGKQRLPGFSGEWETVQLNRIVEEFVVPMRDKPKVFGGDIPWCRIEDFQGKYLYDSKSEQRVSESVVEEMNLKVHPPDTLLVSCSADLGRCAIVKRPLVTNQTFIGLVCNTNRISEEFLFYYMTYNSDTLNNLSSGTIISYLSREHFEALTIVIPTRLEEQTAIAAVLSDMDAEISALEARREKTRRIKQGMMRELLTGRTRLV